MQIDRVKMTGADESVYPEDMALLAMKYPHTEWGILFSKSQEGGKRFPNWDWCMRFGRIAVERDLLCAAHLCGSWVRELIEQGRYGWFVDRANLLPMFQRIQINFHADRHVPHPDFFKVLADMGDKQFIFQMDDVNNPVLEKCLELGLNAVPLFDVSGGIGVVPQAWPKQIEGVYCGYAGGLGPDTMTRELDRISQVVGDAPIWIDMETRIRSENDRVFDMKKVERCLEIVEAWPRQIAA